MCLAFILFQSLADFVYLSSALSLYVITINNNNNKKMQFDIMAQCCSMDGTFIAIALTRSIIIFDSLRGKQIGPNLSFHSDIITSITFSPDNLLASGSFDYTIRIWNLKTQTQIGDPFIKDKATVRFVKYHLHNYINIWNTDNRTLIHSLKCRSNALTINCGPLGNTIVSATNSFISLWNTQSGRKRSLMDKHYNLSINISPNQKLITSGYQRYNLAIEETEVTVRIWSSSTGKLLNKFVIITELLQLFFSQDNYEGHWVAGWRTGFGKFIYKNGNTEIGQWFYSKKQGDHEYYKLKKTAIITYKDDKEIKRQVI